MTMISRRAFIQTGLIGAATLAVAGGVYRFTLGQPPQRFQLDTAAAAALAAIVPAMLQGALPAPPPAATIAAGITRTHAAIAGLPLRTQKEISDLFALLTLAPTRRLLAGVADDWPNAKLADVAAFLQSWRMHRFGMLQSAYQALHDLIIGAWYSDESAWPAIGYPGPIPLPH